MENYGFVRVASAVPQVHIADCASNVKEILQQTKEMNAQGVAVAVFPELALTGYTCADLFGQPALLDEAASSLGTLVRRSALRGMINVVGIPLAVGNRLYNCAVVFGHGTVYGVVPKSYIPNYGEFYEGRWFASGKDEKTQFVDIENYKDVPFGTDLLFDMGDVVMGIEICEDLWVPIPPSCRQAMAGANLLVNLSATDEMVGKHDYLRSLIAQQSGRTMSAYVYSSAGFGESTTDVVFAGNAMIAENGAYVAESERFSFQSQWVMADVDIEKLMTLRRRTTTYVSPSSDFRRVAVPFSNEVKKGDLKRTINPYPFIPQDDAMMRIRCEEIFNIQVNGLAQRVLASHSKTAVVGISGGLDSTLALLVTVRTFDKLNRSRQDIVGITMPGFGTTGRTYNNAVNLMRALGVTVREISIKEACIQHFKDIDLADTDRSVTYENSQARERTQILMDVANQTGGMVIGTGDLSELALGWATYNGDHMSMYNVNGSVPKTLVRYLVRWYAEAEASDDARPLLMDIIDTPISPELLPADAQGNIAQKTEDLVGPYELHDFFLYNFVRFGFRPAKLFFLAQKAFADKYDDEVIRKWLKTFMRRFFNQQFKRSALPDGPKVGTVSLSPRGDWRMPSDASQGDAFGFE